MRRSNFYTSGFTLIEIIIFIGLAAGILIVLAGFVNNISSFSVYFQSSLSAEADIQQTLNTITPEMRAMAQSNLGNYPIEAASATTLIFYSDIDHDGLAERVRYFVNGLTLQKGVIKPTGQPLQYVTGNEVINNVVRNIVSGSTVFSYFSDSYTGTENPMSLPIDIQRVRIIKITLSVDENVNVDPGPITLSAQVTPRNLRSN
jgi:type II secretory pathway pseudopilin PulG